MLKLREFVGEEHYIFCKQEYDSARVYLKNCGKPLDLYDRILIKFHKDTVRLFRNYA